jgi:uncharacterized membrane protein YgcG
MRTSISAAVSAMLMLVFTLLALGPRQTQSFPLAVADLPSSLVARAPLSLWSPLSAAAAAPSHGTLDLRRLVKRKGRGGGGSKGGGSSGDGSGSRIGIIVAVVVTVVVIISCIILFVYLRKRRARKG